MEPLHNFAGVSNWCSHCKPSTQQNVYIAQYIKIKDARGKFDKENDMGIDFSVTTILSSRPFEILVQIEVPKHTETRLAVLNYAAAKGQPQKPKA